MVFIPPIYGILAYPYLPYPFMSSEDPVYLAPRGQHGARTGLDDLLRGARRPSDGRGDPARGPAPEKPRESL